MVNPVPKFPRITTPYGKPGSWAAGYHTGDDYGSPGIHGALVVSTAAGTVVYAGNGGGWGPAYGNHVIVETNGVRHMYAHLNSISTSRGARIKAGSVVGAVGNTGRSFGSHLHYEERTYSYSYGVNDRKPQFNHSAVVDPDGSFGAYVYRQERDHHRALQRRLKDKGFDPGFGDWPTRYYGDGTKSAVSAFQRSLGWSGADADGLPGPRTLEELGLPEVIRFRRDKAVYRSAVYLGNGDSDSVWNIQAALLLEGYSIPNGPTDYFGNQTKNAVKAFQEKQGWTGQNADGIPGPATIAALGLQWVDDGAPKGETDPPVDKPVDPPVNKPEAPAEMPPNTTWVPIDGVNGLRSFAPGGAKICLHTTETTGRPNWEATKSGVPHFTYWRSGKAEQHLPLDVSAYTLKGGEHSPNSGSGVNIQIEIIGYAKDSQDWPQEEYDRLRTFLLWIADRINCKLVFPFLFTGSDGYGQGGAVRQAWDAWKNASGIVTHAHAPYNDHWDAGKVATEKLSQVNTEPEEPEVPEEPTQPEYDWKTTSDALNDIKRSMGVLAGSLRLTQIDIEVYISDLEDMAAKVAEIEAGLPDEPVEPPADPPVELKTVRDAVIAAGFEGENIDIFTAIAIAESGGYIDAVGDYWQIIPSYTVVAGDTLARIAREEFRMGEDYKTLAEFNSIEPPYGIKAGDVIWNPNYKQRFDKIKGDYKSAAYPQFIGGEWVDPEGFPVWGPSVGLFQTRTLHYPEEYGTNGIVRNIEALRDPVFQAQSAYVISGGGENKSPWSVYNNGSYRQFLGQDRPLITGHSQAERWNLTGKV